MVEKPKRGADERQQKGDNEIVPPRQLRRIAAFQQLRDGIGQNVDSGHGRMRIARRGGERRAVLIHERQIRTDQHDLVLEVGVRIEAERQATCKSFYAGRHFTKRGFVHAGVCTPDDRNLLVGRVHAGDLCHAARHARQVFSIGDRLAGNDPARRVRLIGSDIGHGASLRRHEGVEVGRLIRADIATRLEIAHDQWCFHRMQRAAQGVILRLFGRLVEEIVENDRARALAVQCRQDLGQETSIKRRAVGKILHHRLGDADNDDIRVLWLKRRTRGDLIVLHEAIGARQERNMVDGEHRERRNHDGDRGCHRAVEDSLVARQPSEPADQLIHWRGDAEAPPPAPRNPFAASMPPAWSRWPDLREWCSPTANSPSR